MTLTQNQHPAVFSIYDIHQKQIHRGIFHIRHLFAGNQYLGAFLGIHYIDQKSMIFFQGLICAAEDGRDSCQAGSQDLTDDDEDDDDDYDD